MMMAWGAAPNVYPVFIRGTLKSSDVAASKAAHDAIALGGKAKALSLGDSGHYVYLDVGGANQFLGIDLWNSLDGLREFQADPNVQQGFGNLFAAPPEVTVTAHPGSWSEWGTLSPFTKGTPLYIFSVRGTLAAATVDDARRAHNAFADGARAAAQQAGDLAHLVRLRNDDAKQFQALDYWPDLNAAGAAYSDPGFQAGFLALFSAPPTVEPYAHTDWAQW